MVMILMGWVALGLVAGFLISVFVFRKGEDRQLDLLIAVGGAVVGGLIYKMFSAAAVAGAPAFTTRNLLPAVIGAVAAVFIWHMVKGSLLRA